MYNPSMHHPSTLVHLWALVHFGPAVGQCSKRRLLDLGEATTFPLIVYFVPLHEAHIQMGVSKFPKLGLLQLWGPITLCVDLRFR
jgi:hypothetical protein